MEGFFAKLSSKRLKRSVFLSLVELQETINRFIDEYDANDPSPACDKPTLR
ncbi:hypothetical protein FP2506_12119 [Fulvimarina pelagi HTCC2506]|uniref:Transposase n=1 Tax=Fulvimarina pelagi HTCC2506 TaxID=314231 RepID=Q0G1S2_9HYPH|nr:hypothetical protein FP2506_12119 [Fulvimarina pelagi HTCC2506]